MEIELHLHSFNAVTSAPGTDINVGGFKLVPASVGPQQVSRSWMALPGCQQREDSITASQSKQKRKWWSPRGLDLGIHISQDCPGGT